MGTSISTCFGLPTTADLQDAKDQLASANLELANLQVQLDATNAQLNWYKGLNKDLAKESARYRQDNQSLARHLSTAIRDLDKEKEAKTHLELRLLDKNQARWQRAFR
jgi:hypothetical protein